MNKAQRFFYYASAFEASLGVLGWIIAFFYFDTLKPFLFKFSLQDFYFALFLLFPLLVFAVVSMTSFFQKLHLIGDLVQNVKKSLGPFIKRLSFSEIMFLSMCAGIGEEFLFRGALQPIMGLFFSSLVFALFHSISLSYAILSFLMSLYLGWMYEKTGNLFVPVLVHGAYDAFVLLLYRYSLLNVRDKAK